MTRPDRRAQLIAAARHLLETEGAEAITIRRLGAALGIRGPSIYKHVPDKATIEEALAVEGFVELAEVLESVPPTFAAIAGAYRTQALAHPHMHRLLNAQPLNRARLPPGLEERAAAPLITACHGDRALARAAWATMNGLVDLELAERFPPGADLPCRLRRGHPRLRQSHPTTSPATRPPPRRRTDLEGDCKNNGVTPIKEASTRD